MRIRSVLSWLVVVVVGVGAAGTVAGPAAAAETALGRCYVDDAPQFKDLMPWPAAGNRHTPWPAPAGLEREDALRVVASGTVSIDWWGSNKSIAGELPVAGAGWPAPGLRRYMLIARVTLGAMWVRSTGRIYGPGEWFPVGTDSGCMLFLGPDSGGHLVFSFNDPNLGDNGGGAGVSVRQWWGII
jgi:hypothetical protein